MARSGSLTFNSLGDAQYEAQSLGHQRIESTVRYLGVEVDDALEIAEKTDVLKSGASPSRVIVSPEFLRLSLRRPRPTGAPHPTPRGSVGPRAKRELRRRHRALVL